VREVVDAMKEVSGVDFPVREAPRRAGDPPVLIADNAKIRGHLHWKPQCDDLALICKTALEWEKKIA
jgi:UDP-glucose 4-epimerase